MKSYTHLFNYHTGGFQLPTGTIRAIDFPRFLDRKSRQRVQTPNLRQAVVLNFVERYICHIAKFGEDILDRSRDIASRRFPVRRF